MQGLITTKKRATWLKHASLRGGLLFSAVALGMTVAGCAKDGAATGQTQAPVASDLPAVLATVGDQQITLAQVRERAGAELDQVEIQYQRARSRLVEGALEALIRERMLEAEARKQNKSVEELLAAEVGGSLEPSEVEIAAWYQDNQARVGGRSLDQIRTQIADFLREERRKEATQKLEQRLGQELAVTRNFEPFRLAFNNEGAPSLGKPGAAVTVVEFSDFQCPFCQRFAPTLKQLEQNFGDQVHVVYRQFPITSIHPFAFKAAEASLCAHDQGKFWELHDLMFAEQSRLGVTDLKEKARRAGMDQRKFDSCLDSGRFAEQVQRDIEEGNRAGVTGTPAVFVNGTAVPGGAVPYSTVAEAVQKELARGQTND